MLPRRSSRCFVGFVAILALTLSACGQSVNGHGTAATSASGPGSTSPTTTTPSTPTPSSSPSLPDVPAAPASFVTCDQVLRLGGVSLATGLAGKLTASCARYPVPLDYANPNGTKTEVFLLRIHDSDNTAPTGTLLVNPGGPGGSGVELALGLLSKAPVASLLQHFDLLGFDPRGVSLSSPLSCLSNAQKDTLNAASPDVTTAAGLAAAKANADTFSNACEQKYGAGLKFFDTVNTARDMNQIRQAVGDKQLNYLGFSYGTELGSVYAHLFPTTIRAMVLDGAVDPLTSGTTQFANQLQGFESAFDQFAAYCRTQKSCGTLANARAIATKVVASAQKKALATGSSRPLTASLASTGILEALYSKSDWNRLGAALAAAKKGNGAGLLSLADQYNQRSANGTYSNLADSNAAISCNDSAPGPSESTIKSLAKDWATRFPLFGRWSAPSLFLCQQWQPVRTVPPKPTAATPTKVLVIGNLHDPATPYQGAKDLAATMGNAELLSWDGEGHTSYLQGSSCVDKYVNAYLLNVTLPPENTTCPK